MNRWLGASILASLVAVSLAACGDDNGGGSYAPASGGGGSSTCAQYTTCGTCTPVQGCGWCFTSTSGRCESDPDQCANLPEFTWAWNPSGCPGVDASVAPTTDAGRTD